MLMTRWEPFAGVGSDINRLHREMNRLFGRFGGSDDRPSVPRLAGAYPAMNAWENDNNLFVEMELPGMVMEDLGIYVNGDNTLTIKGERKNPTIENVTWHRKERSFGSFSRTVTLPVAVDADKVDAKFSSGVLTITLPKREEAKPRRIEVKSN